jgi:hypothetical protein
MTVMVPVVDAAPLFVTVIAQAPVSLSESARV